MNPHININKQTDLPDNLAVKGWYERLAESLRETNQRLIVNLRGKRAWCLSMLPREKVFSQHIVLSNQHDMKQQVVFSKAETLLGREAECVVYDGFGGINIDVLCMAAGLIRAGGVLILLTSENPHQIDDVYGRWQGCNNEKHYFLHYLLEQLKQGMLVINERDAGVFPGLTNLPFSPPPEFIDNMTCQQMEIAQELNSWLDRKKVPVFVLTADRGRGKSTLLGLFAQQHKANLNIVVTAAAKVQAEVLFKQVDARRQNIQFIAPDEIIRRNATIDCLIIDEAAMLSHNMLQQCVALSDKTLMATTTGGYEGTGQGFLIKFMAGFDSTKLIHRKLKGAIRWGQQDELERWMNRVLLLKPAELNQHQKVSDVLIEQVSKQQLNEDKETLKELYALLVSAHYRTKPSDLRQLMDDQNQQVLLARLGKDVVGVLLLNLEGGFDTKLCYEIFMGKRRPQGHLFAQMITAQAGIKDFACRRGFRVQRIAVNANCRFQGIGRRLIESAERLVKQNSVDYLASNFALDSAMAPFWGKMGFSVVHIASGKGKSSGRQTVAVIKSTDAQVNEVITTLNKKISNYLPVWLLSYCQTMLWPDVYALLGMLNINSEFSALDKDEIVAFSEGYRGFDLTQAVLQKLVISRLAHTKLSKPLIKLLIEKVLLNKEWKDLTEFQGHKENLKQLRLGIHKLNK